MNCQGFRKYVGAFADGELEVNENLRALEHLSMCPACAGKVEEINGMREALRRVYGTTAVPTDLATRIRVALDTDAEAAVDEFADPPPVTALLARVRRYLVPLAAAAIVLIAVAVWHGVIQTGAIPGSVTMVTGRAVADIREQHRSCLLRKHAARHVLTRALEPRTVEIQLENELKLNVLAPELTSAGFEFLAAGPCGVMGHRGAHVQYQETLTGAPLSIFSLSRIDWLGGEARKASTNHDYFVSTDDTLTVVAWHDREQTYALCGPIAERQLLDLVADVRSAGLHPAPREKPFAMLASQRAGYVYPPPR